MATKGGKKQLWTEITRRLEVPCDTQARVTLYESVKGVLH